MTSIISSDSLLVVDVGTVTTRAILFDVVDDSYRFLASGSAPTTAGAPFRNISEGVHRAIDQLQRITGRILTGADAQIIIPTASDGSGVDRFAAVISVGKPIQVVVVGLLESVSLDSARRLAATTYTRVAQVISLNDRRRQDARINAISRTRPELVLLAGGTEGGASQSVMKLLEPVGLACYLMPSEQRPEVLFVGNQSLHEDVQSALGGIIPVHFAPNIRPTLEVEQLDAAQSEISKLTGQIRMRQIAGVEELHNWSGGGLMTTCASFGRVVRFLNKVNPTKKGVLGVDVGAGSTTIAAAFADRLALNVFPQFGLASGLDGGMEYVSSSDVVRWLAMDVPENYVQDYIANKSLNPASLPVTQDELAIEQALARVLMNNAIQAAMKNFPVEAVSPHPGLLPFVEPIIATGSVLTQAAGLAHSAMMILDGLQPTGVTTLVLDQNQIISALGAAAAVNPILAVQVLDSNSLLHLGTVISPVCNVRAGTPVLRLKMTYESGHDAVVEVKQGVIEVLPLPYGQTARLQLQPLHRSDVGMGAPGRGGGLRVMGGSFGVIIDARGRPITLSNDRSRRLDLHKKWLWTLGGQ